MGWVGDGWSHGTKVVRVLDSGQESGGRKGLKKKINVRFEV